MATLSNLKDTVAAYHQRVAADFTVGSTDLFLVEANAVRKDAEKLHDFEGARCTATLSIDGTTGGLLSEAEIFEEDEDAPIFNGIKTIIAIRRTTSAGIQGPVEFSGPGVAIERERYLEELDDISWMNNRYPSDADVLSRNAGASIIQRGNRLFIYPLTTVTSETPLETNLECYAWLRDYTEDDLAEETDPTDFFVENAFNYLKWALICNFNYLFQTFVPRTEGNVLNPTEIRDAAWRDLLVWDTYVVDANTNRPR